MLLETVSGFAVAAGAMAWAVRSPRASVLAPSIWRGAGQRRSVAITFDDGPSESTPRILEILERFNARATFFQCGANVVRLPAVTREIAHIGHEIGNHSFSHPMFQFKSPGFMSGELRRAQGAIQQAAGVTPTLFRAPFGVRWFGLGGIQRDLALQGVMWSVIGLDWKLTAEGVRARLIRGTAPGAIICLHDGRMLNKSPNISVTLEALRTVLPIWADQGFQFETVSQILCKTN